MRIFIDPWVDEVIKSFYLRSMQLHPSLSEESVVEKVNRLYDAIYDNLNSFPYKFSLAEHKEAWKKAGYRDFKTGNFHFAYQIYADENNVPFVVIWDACYDKLYHN